MYSKNVVKLLNFEKQPSPKKKKKKATNTFNSWIFYFKQKTTNWNSQVRFNYISVWGGGLSTVQLWHLHVLHELLDYRFLFSLFQLSKQETLKVRNQAFCLFSIINIHEFIYNDYSIIEDTNIKGDKDAEL